MIRELTEYDLSTFAGRKKDRVKKVGNLVELLLFVHGEEEEHQMRYVAAWRLNELLPMSVRGGYVQNGGMYLLIRTRSGGLFKMRVGDVSEKYRDQQPYAFVMP